MAEAFTQRRKALSYGSRQFRITQYNDGGEELELLCTYDGGGVSREIVVWLQPDWTMLLEVRSRKRKEFGKLLYQQRFDFRLLAEIGLKSVVIPELKDVVNRLVASFEESIPCLFSSDSEEAVQIRLASIWDRFAD